MSHEVRASLLLVPIALVFTGLAPVATSANGVLGGDEQAKLVASDAATFDVFGFSVSLSGDTALIGAPQDDGAAGLQQGSAYVFVRSGSTWTQQAKLVPSDASIGDDFGRSVSLSGDTALIGAPGDDGAAGLSQGSAYVFVRSGSTWTQQAKLEASDAAGLDLFGSSVALSGDTALIGAPFDDNALELDLGSAYAFVRNGSSWTQQAKLEASDIAGGDQFGTSVALCADTAVVGAPYDDVFNGSAKGSGYVFVRSGSTWAQQAKLVASDAASFDQFGTSVAVSGDTAIAGAPRDNAGDSDSGSAYVFVRSGSTWTQQAKLVASDAAGADQLGWSVAVSGDAALVGAPLDDGAAGLDEGTAHLFVCNGTTWKEELIAPSDPSSFARFGYSVSLAGGTAIIGASMGDVAAANDAGSAYAFEFPTITATPSAGAVPLSVVAQFTATPSAGSVPLSVAFFDASGPLPSSWSWDFGDGASSIERNPVHDYTSPGIYTVSLTVSDAVSTDVETKAGLIDVGLSCLARNDAGGVNPLVLTCLTAPLLGTTWQSCVNGGSIGGSGLTIQIGTAGLLAGSATSFGVLLIDLSQPQAFVSFGILIGGTSIHGVFVPNDPTLLGLRLYAQGYIDDVNGSGVLTNGLDLIVRA